MAGRTNYTAVVAGDDFDPPADITRVFTHFDPLIGETRTTISSLPASGNWTGRLIWVTEDSSLRVWTGSAWLVTNSRPVRLIHQRSATQNAGTGNWVSVDMDTVSLASTAFTETGGVYTCQLAGVYKVSFQVQFAGNASGNRAARILKGAGSIAETIHGAVAAGTEAAESVVAIASLAVNDTVTGQGFQSSGGTITIKSAVIEFEKIG